MKHFIRSILLFTILLFGAAAHGESSKPVGEYIVHFNALPTEALPPQVAKAYHIIRSKNRGLLNISVVKKGGDIQGVEADIEVTASNLSGQLRPIKLRKIEEQNALYYIGEFRVSNEETLSFKIRVKTPDGARETIELTQQFFVD
jgi:hypothetical protein